MGRHAVLLGSMFVIGLLLGIYLAGLKAGVMVGIGAAVIGAAGIAVERIWELM